MLRRPLTFGLGLLVLLLAPLAWTDAEYWVAVGSYRTLNDAETARNQASDRLPETFSIAQAELDSGLWYRVLAGPYLTREIADHMLGEAGRSDFENAWILSRESGSISGSMPSVYDYTRELDEESSELPVDPSDYQFEPSQPRVPSSDPVNVPGFNAPVRPDRDIEHKLINEAPEGYELNKLNRDQAALDWSSPFLLATNEASVLAAALAAQAQTQADVQQDSPGGQEEASESGLATESLESLALDLRNEKPLVLQQWDHQQAAIRIDGKLDERPWKDAMSISQLRVTEPDTLVAPLYETDVRLFYTEKGVYVSFDMEQPPETLVKRLSSRDNRDVERDYVSFTLDTSGNARYAYWMTLALGDTQMDGTALPERQFSSNWDGAWWGATAESEHGWTAEFFVPWSQMTMPAQDADGTRRIGFYSARVVAHLDERWAWPPLPQSQPKFMSAFHTVEVSDVNPRQQWSLFPFASSTSDLVDHSTNGKAGFDVFWRPHTNTQLTATVNPDFGTVESDEVVVNLSAFETFFPEKRLFFLEGREIFEATPRTRSWDPITLLNTRRIGGNARVPIGDEDADIPVEELALPSELHGAAKVTGQFGGFRYGVMGAAEQHTTMYTVDDTPIEAMGRNFAIARFLYENNAGGAYRGLGVMSTLTTHEDEDAATAGLDYHFLSTTGAWKMDGQLLYSNLDLTGEGAGGFVDMEYTPRQGMKYLFSYTYLDRGLELNDAGFLRRNDVSGGRIGSEWIKSGFTRFRDLKIETFLRYEENLDGYSIRSGLGGEGEFTLNNLHTVEVGLKYFPERYDDRNSFGNGTYRINDRPSIEFAYNTDKSKAFSGWAFSKWEGDGVDGQKLETGLGVSWRPADRLNIELGTTYQVREGWLLHQEDQYMTAFDADEWQPELKMGFFFNARQEVQVKLQWVGISAEEDSFYQIPDTPGDLVEISKPDDESDDFNISSLNFQIRYRWQIAPLSDVFVVYTRSGLDDTPDESFAQLFRNAWEDPLGEHLVLKLRYRLGT